MDESTRQAWYRRTHQLVMFPMMWEKKDTFFDSNMLPGVYRLPSRADEWLSMIERTAHQYGYLFLRADLRGCVNEEQILKALAKDLKFPAYFGHNWDALIDCLSDLSWYETPEHGYFIVIDHALDFYLSEPEESFVFLSVLWAVIWRLWEFGKRGYLFLDIDEH